MSKIDPSCLREGIHYSSGFDPGRAERKFTIPGNVLNSATRLDISLWHGPLRGSMIY